MKVYKFKPLAPYSDGILLVAANNQNEATELAKSVSNLWTELSFMGLVQELQANVSEPKIIIDAIYEE